jgi:hypothetical protein
VARTGLTGNIALLNSTMTASATTASLFGFHNIFADISTSIDKLESIEIAQRLDLMALKQKCHDLPSWKILSYLFMEYSVFWEVNHGDAESRSFSFIFKVLPAVRFLKFEMR